MCGIDPGEEYEMEKEMIQSIKNAYQNYKAMIQMNLSTEDREFDDEEYFIKSFAQQIDAQLTEINKTKCGVGHTIPPIDCKGFCIECVQEP